MWRLRDARVYALGVLPGDQPEYLLKTNLTPEQVRESFATPETVPFWELPTYINIAEHAGWPPQAIDCSSRSFWRGHFCWPPWFSLPPPSVYGSSALAGSKKWF